jgi:putative hydrolase of the HAD superfamily
VRHDRQVLIFDADDTLWENNVLFERVIDDFLTWVATPALAKVKIRAMLDEIQAANAVNHGYGAAMLLHSLVECFERMRERRATAAERHQINELAARLFDRGIELIPGVAETLTDLGGRHDLLLLTKGDTDEQQRKLDASQLSHHFRSVHIVPEKDVRVYRYLMIKHALPPGATWMIGNSPKSDIIPARQAGLNAVFIPNTHTWVLEQGDFNADEHVLRLRRFSELGDHF